MSSTRHASCIFAPYYVIIWLVWLLLTFYNYSYFIKWRFLWKIFYTLKYEQWISPENLSENYLIPEKTSRYLIKNFAISYQKLRDILSKTYLGLHAMCLICFTILVKRLEFCWKILCETSVKIFKKIHPEGGGLCHVDTWALQRQIRDGTKNRLSKLFERA